MSVNITSVTKLKHTEILKAVKAFGSQRALADHLGLSMYVISRWLNLKACPPVSMADANKYQKIFWTESRINKLEKQLLHITGKLLDELFPEELRKATEFLTCSKYIEQEREIEGDALLEYGRHTATRLTYDASVTAENNELQEGINEVMKSLPYRHREILAARYGLNGGSPKTLEEIGKIYGVSRERIRQMVASAERNLRMPHHASKLAGFLE